VGARESQEELRVILWNPQKGRITERHKMTPNLYYVTEDGLIGIADGLLIVRSDELTWTELQEAVAKTNPKGQVHKALHQKGIKADAVALTKATAYTTPEAAQSFRSDLESKGWVWLNEKVLDTE